METFDQWYDRQPLVLIDRKTEHRMTWNACEKQNEAARRQPVVHARIRGVAVDDDVDRYDLAILGKEVAKTVLSGGVVHVADVNLLGHAKKPSSGPGARAPSGRIRPPMANAPVSRAMPGADVRRLSGEPF